MKKIIFVVLILSMISFSISESQLIRGYGFKVGVASTNQNWDWAPVYGTVSTSTAAYQSLDIGAFIEWLDIPLFSVLTEVQYIRKGSDVTSYHITPFPGSVVFNYAGNPSTRISYLSVPLLAKLRMNGGLLSPYIVAGPRFDFRLSSSNGAFSSGDLKTIDVGGTFGVGVESASILPIQVGLEFRYSPDFQASYSGPSYTVRNRSLELLLVLSM